MDAWQASDLWEMGTGKRPARSSRPGFLRRDSQLSRPAWPLSRHLGQVGPFELLGKRPDDELAQRKAGLVGFDAGEVLQARVHINVCGSDHFASRSLPGV